MKAKLRIARATNDLKRTVELYSSGIGLKVLGSFENHEGFDGVMLGSTDVDYHFEFTYEAGNQAPSSNSTENLIVFYISEPLEFEKIKTQMITAGFKKVKSHNPYWDTHGDTFEDFEGYRVVICRDPWGE